MSCAVQTVELTKRFKGTMALDNLNLRVPEGEICGLVGVNGAGKTTAIKILMNILQPSAGSAEVLGRDSTHVSAEVLRRIGYVSENQELPGAMSATGLLTYLEPLYPTWDNALSKNLLRDFDLPAERKIRHLSHGMRMKVALAAASFLPLSFSRATPSTYSPFPAEFSLIPVVVSARYMEVHGSLAGIRIRTVKPVAHVGRKFEITNLKVNNARPTLAPDLTPGHLPLRPPAL